MALEAVIGIVLAAIFLGESVRPIVALGGVAVLAGAVLAALARRAGRGARVGDAAVARRSVGRNDALRRE